MALIDILFPQSVGPLTYEAPDGYPLAPGTMVEAELRKSLKRACVLGPAQNPPQNAKFKPISTVIGPALSPAMVKLILWMSEYYFTRPGLVLKAVYPREFFDTVKKRKSAKVAQKAPAYRASPPEPSMQQLINEVRSNALSDIYKTFLLHAPTIHYEFDFLRELTEHMENIIIVSPSVMSIKYLEEPLAQAFGTDRLALYHSGMSRGQRSEAVQRVASGEADIVLGSMQAVFAPMQQTSLIAVLHEENALYKAERMPRYNARDIAVMRAYLEGSTVLLSSICPSVESYYNATASKYTLLDATINAARPKVRVVGASARTAVSDTLAREVKKTLKNNQRAFVHVKRKGYALLVCEECGYIERCTTCNIPLFMHKSDSSLHCGYCKNTRKPPAKCPKCGGAALAYTGSGLERVEEQLSELNPVGVSGSAKDTRAKDTRAKDTRAKGAKSKDTSVLELTQEPGLLAVGTKALTHQDSLGESFMLGGIVDAEAGSALPDFRAGERAMQDLMYAAAAVNTTGQLIVQTRRPTSAGITSLKSFSLKRFYDEELQQRQEAAYPPFGKLVMVTIKCKESPPAPTVRQKDTTALGPAPFLGRKGITEWRVLFKSTHRQNLILTVNAYIKKLGKLKHTVDTDPIEA